MIPIKPQPEPDNFEQRVRKPGQNFLEKIPSPNSKQWKGKEFWRRSLPEMRTAYGAICAYCSFWIPYSTGNASIDHFLPRSRHPALAYEWTNFRYVSSRFNSRKGMRAIIDPFILSPEWFILDFSTFFVQPSPLLSQNEREKVDDTVEILQLNSDDDLVYERFFRYKLYVDREVTFAFIYETAPFLAYEIERQGRHI